MNKIIISIALTFLSIGLFAQKNIPTNEAIYKLMNFKNGMASINELPDSMSKKMTATKAASFKAELTKNKENLINTAYTTFKKDYTAQEIDFIYSECTSDKIDYTDLTNNFFSKWRRLKGELFFKGAKEIYFKYQ